MVYIENSGRRAPVILISNSNNIAYQKNLPGDYFSGSIEPSVETVFAHLNLHGPNTISDLQRRDEA